MRVPIFFSIGLTLCLGLAQAQTAATGDAAAATNNVANDFVSASGVVGSTGTITTPDYQPLTNFQRMQRYLLGTFGPGAILKSAVTGGISQAINSPKEWGGGAAAYGDRVGSSFAEHVVRQTLESGAALALHEDNRYFRSTGKGFWKRTVHATTSIFVARNDAGAEHFAYSRIGGAAGAAFISRIWEPRSVDSSGDAAVNFGLNMAATAGWNTVKEFGPQHLLRRR